MAKTVRLLSTYKGFKPQNIVTLPDAEADALLLGGIGATLNLAGGTVAYQEAPYVGSTPAPEVPDDRTLYANQSVTLRIQPGVTINLTGSSDVSGTQDVLFDKGNVLVSLPLQPGSGMNVGPFLVATLIRLSVKTGTLSTKVVRGGSGLTERSRFDVTQARTNNAKRAQLIYDLLPPYAPFGRELAEGGIYYDANYVGGNSDGTKVRPNVSPEGVNFNVDGQVVNFARGSRFYINTTRITACQITGRNVTFRDYGDPALPPPVITGLKEVTGFTLNATTQEYEATLTQAIVPNCMAITFEDILPKVLINGTAGSLAAGQAAYSAGKLYIKDNPTGRKVLASVTGNAIHIKANGFRADGVQFGYTHNNTIAVLSDAPGGIIDDTGFRDTACWSSGNTGVSLGDAGKGATNTFFIRHKDEGAYNNAISGQGDDSNCYVIEAKCDGKQRRSIDTSFGYRNDAVTAHGIGFGKWVVAGCILSNSRENNIDIIGGQPGSGQEADVHRGSIVMFNRCQFAGQINIFGWAAFMKVIGNIATDSCEDPIRIGNQDPITVAMTLGGEVAYNFTARGSVPISGVPGIGSSGIGFVWGGVHIHHNTMEISPAATRAAHGSTAISALSGGRVENNHYLMFKDNIALLQFDSSGSVSKFNFRGNVYTIIPPEVPSGSPVLPFRTGGTNISFTDWQTVREKTARSFTSLTDAGVTGALYAPNVNSPLANSEAFTSPGYDVNARFANGGVGAVAVSETV